LIAFLDDAIVATRCRKTVIPGEKRELPLKFSVDYPADLPVSGLE
jgi:hypothetical protein